MDDLGWLIRDADPMHDGAERARDIFDQKLREIVCRQTGIVCSFYEETFPTVDTVLSREPLLSRHFSREEFAKLAHPWIAVLGRYHRSAEYLLRYRGTDVDLPFGSHEPQVVDEKSTLLHALLRMEASAVNEGFVRLLVTEREASLQARDSEGRTALHYAAMRDRAQLVELFLDEGADAGAVDVRGNTPLALIRARNLRNPTVRLIVKALALRKLQPSIEPPRDDESLVAADPELWDFYQDCLEHAYRTKFVRFAENCTFFQLLGEPPRRVAALMRSSCPAEFEANFQLHDLRVFSMYAEDLARAFVRGRSFHRSLLEQRAKIEGSRRVKANAIIDACSEGRVDLVEMYLEEGVDVNYRHPRNGLTPLLAACRSYVGEKLVALLARRGADVLAKDREGYNALHHAAIGPFSFDMRVQNLELARFLIKKGVSLHDRGGLLGMQPLHQAAGDQKAKLVKLLLDYGADVNALTTERSLSPLHLADSSLDRNTDTLEALVEGGADVNARMPRSRLALHWACARLRPNCVRLYLSAGADVLLENDKGKTAFVVVLESRLRSPDIDRMVVRALALKRVGLQPSIELRDESRLEAADRELWSYYRDCLAHLRRMKLTRLVGGCTFFELLAKSRCQVAALMRNPNFEANFIRLYDLDRFDMYAEDVLRAFERARRHLSDILEREDAVDRGFRHALPYVVVRKIAGYSFACCGKCDT